MFRSPFSLTLLLGALLLPAMRADDTLVHAQRAQAMLGPGVWSQVIRIENDARRSPYPPELHALVFELVGVLWFYTSLDGTQSFSLHEDNLAAEKADFAPLLRDIEPGFRRWTALPGAMANASSSPPLPNGCFIESVAAWRELVLAGERATEPKLFSYYVQTAKGLKGHTVLTFAMNGMLEVIDVTAGRTKRVPMTFRADPGRLVRRLTGLKAARTRWLPLGVPETAIGGEAVATKPAHRASENATWIARGSELMELKTESPDV